MGVFLEKLNEISGFVKAQPVSKFLDRNGGCGQVSLYFKNHKMIDEGFGGKACDGFADLVEMLVGDVHHFRIILSAPGVGEFFFHVFPEQV